jgi:hypothetical protein
MRQFWERSVRRGVKIKATAKDLGLQLTSRPTFFRRAQVIRSSPPIWSEFHRVYKMRGNPQAILPIDIGGCDDRRCARAGFCADAFGRGHSASG